MTASLTESQHSGATLRLSRRAWLAASCAVALAGCGRRPALGVPLAREAVVLCVGDSLTRGRGAEPHESYPSQLGQAIERTVVNAGVDGDTSEAVLARLPALLQTHRPGLVLLGAGGNDFLRRVPLERTRQALSECVRLATAQAQLVLIAQPRPAILSALAQSLEDHPLYGELSGELEVPCYAAGWSRVLSTPSLRSDPVHANARGYARFSEDLVTWLRTEQFV